MTGNRRSPETNPSKLEGLKLENRGQLPMGSAAAAAAAVVAAAVASVEMSPETGRRLCFGFHID